MSKNAISFIAGMVYGVIIGLLICTLAGCASTRGVYVKAPIEPPIEPVELAITFAIITTLIIIGLSKR